MDFIPTLTNSIRGMFPGILFGLVFPLAHFIIVEQSRPAGEGPGWRGYVKNKAAPGSLAPRLQGEEC